MEISKTDKVEAVVSRHLKAARVLRDHGIDFWAESARTIGEVCRESGVSFQKIVRQIQLASERPAKISPLSGKYPGKNPFCQIKKNLVRVQMSNFPVRVPNSLFEVFPFAPAHSLKMQSWIANHIRVQKMM